MSDADKNLERMVLATQKLLGLMRVPKLDCFNCFIKPPCSDAVLPPCSEYENNGALREAYDDARRTVTEVTK